jgi:hypothetical protein
MSLGKVKIALSAAALTLVMVPNIGIAQVPPPEPGKADADTSLTTRKELNALAKQVIAASDKGQNLQPIVAFVRSTWRKIVRSNSLDPATATQVEDIDIDAVANALATLGYTNPDLRKTSGNRQDLVLAAQNIVLGRPSIEDMVTLSPEVIVGDLVSVTFDATPADGFGSTAVFRVAKSVKGGLAVGSMLSVRQRSGSSPDDYVNASDFLPSMTGTYVMFLSQSAYGVRAKSKNAAGYLSRIMLPYSVEGDKLIPTGTGQDVSRTVQELAAL